MADKFADFGDVKNIQVNLDRRSGFVKGYALIEYARFEEAKDAIESMDGKNLLGASQFNDAHLSMPLAQNRIIVCRQSGECLLGIYKGRVTEG